jgi:hypothetical protein
MNMSNAIPRLLSHTRYLRGAIHTIPGVVGDIEVTLVRSRRARRSMDPHVERLSAVLTLALADSVNDEDSDLVVIVRHWGDGVEIWVQYEYSDGQVYQSTYVEV